MASNIGAMPAGPGPVIRDEELDTFVKSNGMDSMEQQAHDCTTGLLLLRTTLLGELVTEVADDLPHTFMSTVQGVTLIFSPIGAYFLGCWDSSATISCCVAGTPSSDTFFDIALQRLRRNQNIILLKADENGLSMFQISINGILFSIQYHQTPFTASWAQLSRGRLEENLSLAPGAKRRFNTYRDALYLRSVVPNQAVFNRAYLALKLWAQRHGIFSEAFGFLDETTLLFMVAEASCHPDILSTRSPARIVLTFFDYFSTRDLTDFVIGDSIRRLEKVKPRSQFGDGMVVCSYHSPRYNLSNIKTAAHARIIQHEITNSAALLRDNRSLDIFFGTDHNYQISYVAVDPLSKQDTQATSMTPYVYDAVAYIKIEAAHWAASRIEKGRYFDSTDTIVANFARKLALKQDSDLLFRSWPVRLRRQKDADTDTPGPYHCAYYLIGLHNSSALPRKGPNVGSLQTTFETALRRDITSLETSFSSINLNPNSSFFAVDLVTRDQLAEESFEDDLSFGPIPIDEAELDDRKDESQMPEEEELQAVKPKVNRTKKSKKGDIRDTATENNLPRSRLRPALDVLNRLRFDGRYTVDDYVIGYEDRHAGIMEMPVTAWKTSDTTSEEFIPQSRIVYYKRKSDGVEVWNRRTRLDVIFGSGGRGQAE